MDRELFYKLTEYLIDNKAITSTDIYLNRVYDCILHEYSEDSYIWYVNQLLKGGITFEELIKNINHIAYVYFSSEELINLKTVTITDNITDISEKAFCDTPITEISFNSSSLHSIPSRCCHNCYALIKLNIGPAIYTIDMFAFANCSSLSEIIIPANVTIISDWAFRHCRNLKKVEFEILNGTLEIASTTFESCRNLEQIIVHTKFLFDLFRSENMQTYKAEIIFKP